MPNTYSWDVSALGIKDESGLTDVVKEAFATLTADDGVGQTASLPFTSVMGPPDPGDFTPFASLTEAEVISWIEAEMGIELPKAKAFLDGIIASRIIDTQVAPPWAE